jgi:hypothetical protein
MATNRQKRTRNLIKIPTSKTAWAILTDSPLPDDHNPWEAFQLEGDGCRHLWELHRGLILDEWISNRPCSRPSCWWQFDAPRWHNPKDMDCFWYGKLSEPRQRISGTGSLHRAFVPLFDKGIPQLWDAKSLDAGDPLFFESEAAFLQRHDLLTDTEKKWLKTNKQALKPEKIEV